MYSAAYDTYGVDKALQNFYIGNNKVNLEYDLTKSEDRHILYKQYVGWMKESSSLQPMTSYLNNNLFTRLPRLPAYFSDEVDVCPNQPIELDFTRSRGYTKPKHEPVTRSDAYLRIILDLTDAVPALKPYMYHLRPF